ncbi:MAG: hypothetical protein GXY08_00755 [Ruminococcus sp.]|nr:hypothetical protein [Ruminococcus sp.]
MADIIKAASGRLAAFINEIRKKRRRRQIMGVQRVCDPLAGRCAREGSALPEKQYSKRSNAVRTVHFMHPSA